MKNYWLAEASHNTFVLFDYLNAPPPDEKALKGVHDALLLENRDDALILVEGQAQGEALYLRMRVLGVDNTWGEFCGNGACACAAYLFQCYPEFKQFFILTTHGIHPLTQSRGGAYSIGLPPARFECNTRFMTALPDLHYQYVEVIEPHLLIKGIFSDEEVLDMGRALNQQRELFPEGINLNAWYELGQNRLFVRTYERGVQRLTQSCGTGSMACSAAYRTTGDIEVVTRGGLLKVAVRQEGITLTGPGFFFDRDKRAAEG